MNSRSDDSIFTAPGRILVVDDNRLSGRKLAKASQALGHEVEVVTNGEDAIEQLRLSTFDIVLLDIVMPIMDGFAVLETMKADSVLRDIPVIVVSALEDQVGNVARAIELGAEDFLPKDFELTILRARINASLARKRFRERELEYFRDIDTLTNSAQIIERGEFNPSELGTEKVALRDDPLGRLATVFHGLAEEIYQRERRMDQTVRTLRGTILVLIAGCIFGISPALGGLASGLDMPPLGLVIWANGFAAIACILFAYLRGRARAITVKHLGFLVVWALLLGCGYQLLTIVIAKHVEATLMSLAGSSRGFMVFMLAAIVALEPPSLKRLLGLGLGFVSVSIVLLLKGYNHSQEQLIWLGAAFSLPFLLSLHTILMSWRPNDLDPSYTVGLMLAISTIILAPISVASGTFYVPEFSLDVPQLIIIALGLSTAIALVLGLEIVSTTGPVFASQMAYSQTLAGIAWGIVLLNESMSPYAWAALVLVLIGFWLVAPKQAGGNFRIRLNFKKQASAPKH
ncbi:MAG TPA: response regulator [Marinobacterium sp.]|nr:response regulator [Marinobacterium sp.]